MNFLHWRKAHCQLILIRENTLVPKHFPPIDLYHKSTLDFNCYDLSKQMTAFLRKNGQLLSEHCEIINKH